MFTDDDENPCYEEEPQHHNICHQPLPLNNAAMFQQAITVGSSVQILRPIGQNLERLDRNIYEFGTAASN